MPAMLSLATPSTQTQDIWEREAEPDPCVQFPSCSNVQYLSTHFSAVADQQIPVFGSLPAHMPGIWVPTALRQRTFRLCF